MVRLGYSGELEQVARADWIQPYVAPVVDEYVDFYRKEKDTFISAYVVRFQDNDGDLINVVSYENEEIITIPREHIRRDCYIVDHGESTVENEN